MKAKIAYVITTVALVMGAFLVGKRKQGSMEHGYEPYC